MKIKSVEAYEILASGGYPSIEAKVTLDNGISGIASVPYGASAGSHEATVLNDNDQSRYEGKGMLKSVNNIEKVIAPEIIGMNPENQEELDNKMIKIDGTPNKANLGGNSILAVSLANARATANALNKPFYKHIIDTFDTKVDLTTLPKPMIVVIEGGKHADDTTDLQEFCISGISETTSAENIRMAIESYHQLKKVLKENNLSTNVGNEGAFAPNGIATNESPFQFMLEAIDRAGYKAGEDLGFSIDAAASEFYSEDKYKLRLENKELTATELIEYYMGWLEKYPIVTIEDMLAEDDWDNWVKLNTLVKDKHIDLIGDDLTVTNVERLQKAIDLNAISSILIKLNQIGSLTETVKCCMLAKEHGMSTVTSHRGGGETDDTAMVDLAVAVGSRFIKVGPTRGERVSKYNRLMRIEAELNKY
ncbi:phosphopyruvate hydratase [Candidatus Dojkabacteria bacterium]|nr:phosphopyruvate hydratase [Candidatus Dojkabacteria bacterium]